MKKLIFVIALLSSCDDADDSIVLTQSTDHIVVSKPQPNCWLEDDGYTCHCELASCGKDGLEAAGARCNFLRSIVESH